jgi:hypothetical protein
MMANLKTTMLERVLASYAINVAIESKCAGRMARDRMAAERPATTWSRRPKDRAVVVRPRGGWPKFLI